MGVFDNLGRLFALECSLFKQMFHMLPENLLALELFYIHMICYCCFTRYLNFEEFYNTLITALYEIELI